MVRLLVICILRIYLPKWSSIAAFDESKITESGPLGPSQKDYATKALADDDLVVQVEVKSAPLRRKRPFDYDADSKDIGHVNYRPQKRARILADPTTSKLAAVCSNPTPPIAAQPTQNRQEDNSSLHPVLLSFNPRGKVYYAAKLFESLVVKTLSPPQGSKKISTW